MSTTTNNNETSADDAENASKQSNTPVSASEINKTNNFQRIAQKKMLVRGYSRSKKLEKLAVYSSCKVNYL